MTGWGIAAHKEFRNYLKEHPSLGEIETDELVSQLPKNWQRLVAQYGARKVFACLRDNLTIGGAKFRLRQ
jgi:hypothetical protein